MSRQRVRDERDSGWHALAWGAAAAVAVTILLVASVGLVWLVGRAPSSSPAVGAQPDPTPTPRALSINRVPPTPEPPTVAAEPNAEEVASVPDPAATPSLLAMLGGDGSQLPGGGAILSAPGDTAFASFASGSWSASGDALRNEGTTADAEPWLKLADVPGSAFAVEAEIRVNGLLDTFCDQSFGLAGGNPDAGQVYGGGLLFPCTKDAARARLTDVTVWEDGYHADPLIAENAFDPGSEWRTYRFEVRDDRLRLIVDGVGIVSGSLDTTLEGTGNGEAGLWSHGVDLDIRSIEIVPLPAS